MLRRSARILSRAGSQENKSAINPRKTFSTKDLTVNHDRTGNVFYIEMGKERAFLEYDQLNSYGLDLLHTEVPKVFQGLGVGKILAKAAFEHCVENNLKMMLTCEYLQKYYRENQRPEYSSRVIKDSE